MEIIKITIDGKTVETVKGATILAAAKTVGIKIPSLCHRRDDGIGNGGNLRWQQ